MKEDATRNFQKVYSSHSTEEGNHKPKIHKKGKYKKLRPNQTKKEENRDKRNIYPTEAKAREEETVANNDLQNPVYQQNRWNEQQTKRKKAKV